MRTTSHARRCGHGLYAAGVTAALPEQDRTALEALRAVVRLPTVARPDGAVPEPGSASAEAFDDLVDELAVTHGIAGDVSDKFSDHGPLTLLTLEIEQKLLAAAKAKAAQ